MPYSARLLRTISHLETSQARRFTRTEKKQIEREITGIRNIRLIGTANRPNARERRARILHVLGLLKAAGKPPGPVKLVAALALDAGMRTEQLRPLVYACEKLSPEAIGGSPKTVHKLSIAVSEDRLPKIFNYIARAGREIGVSELAEKIPDNIEGEKKKRHYRDALAVLRDMGFIVEQPKKSGQREMRWLAAKTGKNRGRLPVDSVPYQLFAWLAEKPARITDLKQIEGSPGGIAQEKTVVAWLNAWERAGLAQRGLDGYYSISTAAREAWAE